MKRPTLLLAAIFALSFSVFAQSEAPKTISGGVLNGKAVSLPKPEYPAAARAVNSEGTVTVQVLIDEAGNVASATAVAGPPLMRSAAVQAAQAAKFSPTFLNGDPVKVSGLITYRFVGAMTPGMFGFQIAFGAKTGKLADMTLPDSLVARLPDYLATEKLILQSLTYEPTSPRRSAPDLQAPAPAKTEGGGVTVKLDGSPYSTQTLTAESAEQLRILAIEVEGRLAGNPAAQWDFRFGKALGILGAEMDDEQKRLQHASELEQLAVTAPPSFTAGDRLKALIKRARSGEYNQSTRMEMIRISIEMRNLRISQW